jgi:cytochrome c-type biogenesis protein
MIEVGILVAFLGGILSFASPCCLPLVPAYVGYMVGAATDGPGARRRAFFHGLAFVTGFSIVFVVFWASIGAIGYVLADQAVLFRRLGGFVLVVLGLQAAGVINLQALWRDTRPMPVMVGGPGLGGYARSLVFGTIFAAGWSPCIGPILGGILGLATVTASVAQGTVLLVAYAAGLAIPFLAVALGADWVAHRLTWVARHHRVVSSLTGAALILIGVLMITDTLARLATLTSPLGS